MKYFAVPPRHPWLRGRQTRLAGLLLAGLLTACGTDPTLGPFDENQRAAMRQGQEPVTPAANGAQATPQQASPAIQQAVPAAPPPEVVSLPPLQLLGMSSANVIQELGQPTFQRRERNALLLRYRQGKCILDLFLYPEGQNGSEKAVSYIEARTPGGEKVTTEPCVDSIRKSYRAG